MRTAYGAQWKHATPEAMQVWLNALMRFTSLEIKIAVEDSLSRYIDFPPNLPQFIQLCTPSQFVPRPTTYLPPPEISRSQAVANKVMLRVLIEVGGVSKSTHAQMTKIKNVRADGCNPPTKKFVRELHSKLTALAHKHDA